MENYVLTVGKSIYINCSQNFTALEFFSNKIEAYLVISISLFALKRFFSLLLVIVTKKLYISYCIPYFASFPDT